MTRSAGTGAAAILSLVLAAGGAFAAPRDTDLRLDEGDVSARASFLEEIIVTNDALNGPNAVSDVILHLRGTLDVLRQTDIGRFGLSFSASAHEFRTVDIENDRMATAGVNYARAIGESFALRAALGYGVKDQGDDLDLGSVLIGTRTTSRIATGSLETAARLENDVVLQASFANSYEHVDQTRFTIDIPDLRLTPSRNSLKTGFAVVHAVEGFEHALLAHAERITLHGEVPFASAFASERIGIAGRFTMKGPLGFDLSAEAGADHLRDAVGFTNRLYPVYALKAERSAAGGPGAGLLLRGYLDMADGDDPLGSYVHRAEFELSQPMPLRLTASAGLFGELRDNLALGNAEEAFGLYLALAHDPMRSISVLLRLDYEERHRTVVDLDQTTLAARLGLRFRL